MEEVSTEVINEGADELIKEEEKRRRALGDRSDEDSEDEENSSSRSSGEESGNEIENEGRKWLDVRDLRQLTLQEVQALLTAEDKGDDGGKEDKEGVPQRRKNQPIRKVVIRRLPPDITAESYLEQIPEMPTYSRIRVVPQHEDFPSRIGARSSIYITFENEQEAIWFKEKYNNMTFFDENGFDYTACVDFSLVQEILEDPPDPPEAGTLEESEDYKKFLETYEQNPWAFCMKELEVIKTPEEMLNEILNKPKEEIENTPLLQFLRNRNEKEEILRKERRERDQERRRREESARRKRKEEEKKKSKEKEESIKRDKEKQRDRKRERDRERQRERDRERRLRKEKAKLAAIQEKEGGETTGAAPSQGTSSKVSDEKDKEAKSKYSGTVTYSRSGNPTRWSENSGPRKGDKRKEDKPKEGKSSEAQSQTSKDKQSDSKESKSAFGKPFPSKESEKKPSSSSNTASKATEDKAKPKSSENSSETKTEEKAGTASTSTGANSDPPIKKRIVKRVIRVKKVSKEEDNGGGGDNAGGEKPKKVIRVVKKSTKLEEGPAPADSKPAKKQDDNGKGAGDAKPEKREGEKERKDKKGRPEIQIYRPGSLRASNSNAKGKSVKNADGSGGSAPKDTKDSAES